MTQHQLTRLIDTGPSFARAKLTTVRLCKEERGNKVRYYLLLKLECAEGREIWLRLQQKPVRDFMLRSIHSIVRATLCRGLRDGSCALSAQACVSASELQLRGDGRMLNEYTWDPSSSPTLHTLQHALCVIYDSFTNYELLVSYFASGGIE